MEVKDRGFAMKYKITVVTPISIFLGFALELTTNTFTSKTIKELEKGGYEIVRVQRLDEDRGFIPTVDMRYNKPFKEELYKFTQVFGCPT